MDAYVHHGKYYVVLPRVNHEQTVYIHEDGSRGDSVVTGPCSNYTGLYKTDGEARRAIDNYHRVNPTTPCLRIMGIADPLVEEIKVSILDRFEEDPYVFLDILASYYHASKEHYDSLCNLLGRSVMEKAKLYIDTTKLAAEWDEHDSRNKDD